MIHLTIVIVAAAVILPGMLLMRRAMKIQDQMRRERLERNS